MPTQPPLPTVDVTPVLHLLRKRRLLLLIVALFGVLLFVSMMYYWVSLTFVTPDYVVRQGASDGLAQAAWVLSKDLFLLVLSFLSLRIAWKGFASLHNLFQTEECLTLIASRLNSGVVKGRQYSLLFNKLLAIINQKPLSVSTAEFDGIKDITKAVALLRSLVPVSDSSAKQQKRPKNPKPRSPNAPKSDTRPEEGKPTSASEGNVDSKSSVTPGISSIS